MERTQRNNVPLKVLYFFPHNPCPPHSGAHIRGLEILNGLVKSECNVFFCSSTYSSETVWDDSSKKNLENLGIAEVLIYQKTFCDKLVRRVLLKFYSFLHREPPVNSYIYSPLAMRRWFKSIQKRLNPDIIWMNYSRWDSLIDHSGKQTACLVIDYHDLLSRNLKMKMEMINHFRKNNSYWEPSNDKIISENFFSGYENSTDPNELHIITSYDRITAISRYEADLIKKYDNTVNIIYIPVTFQPVLCDNSYTGSAIFVTGPNVFNLQGFYYFSDRILSNILQVCPSFTLWVTGYCSDKVRPAKSVSLLGYVKDLKTYYCSARFAVCPVLGGTGQQIKIVEAMAHGLSVVATKYSASTSPVIHGYNGYIADNAEEFAEYCIKLWQNPDLCREMGNAARKTIQENFSDDMLMKKLSEVINIE